MLSTTTTLLLSDIGVRVVRPLTSMSESLLQVVKAPDSLCQVLPALSHGPLSPEKAAQEVEGHTQHGGEHEAPACGFTPPWVHIGVVVDQRRAHIINLCTIVHICVSISWDKHPCMYIALLLIYEGRKVDRVTSLTLFMSKIQQLKDGGAGEAGLGAQTAACVGGDVLRCPPPGSPRSDVGAPPLPAWISGSLA